MTRAFAVLATLLAAPSLVSAHEGHGLAGAHWHASDAWGYVVIAACVAAAWWASRGK